MTDLSDRYAELLLEFPPRPIRSEEELKQAQNAVNSILDQETLGKEEREYINVNVLGTLIHEYEQIHHHIPDIYGVELLEEMSDTVNVLSFANCSPLGIVVQRYEYSRSGTRNRSKIAL